MGYQFPGGLAADAVVISHPHFDHDASYYFDEATPTFRVPGVYAVGDVRLIGIASKHAGRALSNVLWVVEVGGFRSAHTGDNGPLTEDNLEALGRIDLLMTHFFFQDYTDAQVEAINPRVVIPMHYRLPEIADRGPRPLGPWLEGRNNVVRLGTDTAVFSQPTLPEMRQIHVFTPSPLVTAWPPALIEAWEAWSQANEQVEDETAGDEALQAAARHYERAVSLYPTFIRFYSDWGALLGRLGQTQEAIRTLEGGQAKAGRGDWESMLRARGHLARLYREVGRTDLAQVQYRLILAQRDTYAEDVREEALAFIDSLDER